MFTQCCFQFKPISLSSGWVWLFWDSSWCQQHQAQTDLDHSDRPAEQVKWKLGAACRWEHICLSVFSPCSGLTTMSLFFFLSHSYFYLVLSGVWRRLARPPPCQSAMTWLQRLQAVHTQKIPHHLVTGPFFYRLPCGFDFKVLSRLTQGGSGSDLTAIVSSQGPDG